VAIRAPDAANDIWKPGVMTLSGCNRITRIIAIAKERRLSAARSNRTAPNTTASMMKARWVETPAPERMR